MGGYPFNIESQLAEQMAKLALPLKFQTQWIHFFSQSSTVRVCESWCMIDRHARATMSQLSAYTFFRARSLSVCVNWIFSRAFITAKTTHDDITQRQRQQPTEALHNEKISC